jgi:hypothetical protein
MPATFDKQRILTTVENTITPYIGRAMAQASTKVHCEKLGFVSDNMTQSEVKALLERIGQAMLVFVGKEKADQILGEINTTIGLGG